MKEMSFYELKYPGLFDDAGYVNPEVMTRVFDFLGEYPDILPPAFSNCARTIDDNFEIEPEHFDLVWSYVRPPSAVHTYINVLFMEDNLKIYCWPGNNLGIIYLNYDEHAGIQILVDSIQNCQWKLLFKINDL